MKVGTEQSSEPMSSSRALHPMESSNPRQDNAAVDMNTELGTRSSISADGDESTNRYEIKPCGARACLTCDILVTDRYYTSNVTNCKYEVINHSNDDITCKSSNVIYLLSRKKCRMQYVGESITPLNIRMNTHRTSKKGCQHIIEHFRETCTESKFSVQIIVKYANNGYNKYGTIDEEMKVIRRNQEDILMKKLRVIYPYGLNSKTREKSGEKKERIGLLFPPLPRTGERPTRSRINRNNRIPNTNKTEFLNIVNSYIEEDLTTAFNKIRILLDKTKKRILKEVAYTIMMENSEIKGYKDYHQWFEYILDSIDTKLYTPNKPKEKKSPKIVCVVKYVNKGLDDINLRKIIKNTEILDNLPVEIKLSDYRPIVTYKLGSTIRNKIFNYRSTVESITVDNGEFINTLDCMCSSSKFRDDALGHIVTGNLQFIENNKLRKILSKGPNYREPKAKNYNACVREILIAIDRCAQTMSDKFKIDIAEFANWKNRIIEAVENKVYVSKKKFKYRKVNQVLQDQDTLEYLSKIHDKFVVVPIDKAANNVAFICKKYYIERILKEIGLFGTPSNTYNISNIHPDAINSTNFELCEQLHLNIPKDSDTLPAMYWIPKLHKSPVGARFIIAAKRCSIKPLSKAIMKVFKLIYKQIENFHAKGKFYSNYNLFWVIQNSRPVIEKLNSINNRKKAKSITTYDFSTLYTNIHHADLITKLEKVIDIAFGGGKSRYIRVNDSSAYWSNYKSNNNTCFNIDSLKRIVKYLITDSYFSVGNVTLIQRIGLPMGLDVSGTFANLYLHRLEYEFLIKLIKYDARAAYYYNGCMRYIDDLCCLNDDGNFGKNYKNIYPKELELKCENKGNHATFLDMEILVRNGQYAFKQYDKRDKFLFHINRMPHIDSNIPKNIFYGSILAEILRLARASLFMKDFTDKLASLFKRMINQGGDKNIVYKQLTKSIENHTEAFNHFNMNKFELKNVIASNLRD